MKRDLYAEVSARIVAELEAGAAPWIKPWSATPGANTPCNAVTNRPYSGCNVILLWMAQAAGYRTPRFLTFKQALELGGNVRKGERGSKVFFVKQLQVRDKGADDNSETRLVPMMREYTVFNVDQCENVPDSITTGKRMRVRNPDARDDLADAFSPSGMAHGPFPTGYSAHRNALLATGFESQFGNRTNRDRGVLSCVGITREVRLRTRMFIRRILDDFR
jgi:antirestriction protein ArdC